MSASARPLPPGTWVVGKWTNRRWRIRGVLGVGANGTVYAVERDDGLPGAMKVCETAGQVAFEWSLLNLVRGPRSPFPAPQQIDDSDRPGARFFYVMERISGRPLDKAWPGLTPALRKRVMLENCRRGSLRFTPRGTRSATSSPRTCSFTRRPARCASSIPAA